MSFFKAYGGAMARSLWPPSHPRFVRDFKADSDLIGTDVVPLNTCEMHQWCFIDIDHDVVDRSRAHVLLYLAPPEPDLTQEVSLRFQGYVAHAELGVFGNWDRSVEGAPRAVQSLSLAGLTERTAFQPQIDGLEFLKEFVINSLRGTYSPNRRKSRIEFERRVFTKMTNQREVKSALTPGDDPTQQAQTVAGLWTVASKIRLGEQHANNVRPASYLQFHKGDFVDVLAAVDIWVRPRYQGRRVVKVNLRPIRVVKLLPHKPTMQTRSSTNDTLTRETIRKHIRADTEDAIQFNPEA